MATTQEIHAAADALAAAGQQPTLAAVRTALGGGSFTTISEAMKGWRAAQQAAAPIREAAPVAVTDRMGELAAEIWGVAIGMANDRLFKEREALEQARQEIAQVQQEAAELADQMAVDLDAARAQIAQQAAQIADQTAGLAAAAALQAALDESRKRGDELAVLLQAAQQRADAAISAAGRMAGKLEALEAKPKKNPAVS